MSWAQTRLYGDFNRLFWLTIRTPVDQRNHEQIRATEDRLNAHYRLLDAHLSTHRFVAGDRLTMADIPTGSTLYRYVNMPIDRPKLPHLERWYRTLSEREAYKKYVMVSFEELRGRLTF